MSKVINVAIDGPAGAGKSTISRAAAAKLGFIYIDTGALYRTVGVNALRQGADVKNASAVVSTLTDELNIELKFIDGEQRMFLNGEDVSVDIRTPEASMAASAVSAVPEVRKYLFDLQKNLAQNNNCIMDGRDIGTVVLPDADVKIFLTASPEERARRRFLEMGGEAAGVDFDKLLAEINQRDWDDSHRAASPLCRAEDAIELDSSTMTKEEVIDCVLRLAKERM